MLTQKGPRREGVTRAALSSFVDDPEIRRLHEERLEELLRSRAEARDREEAERKAPVWGDVEEVDEKGFLEATTSTPRVVCHFAHPEFARCKVMKERLKELAHKHPRTRFIQVSAPVRREAGEGGAGGARRGNCAERAVRGGSGAGPGATREARGPPARLASPPTPPHGRDRILPFPPSPMPRLLPPLTPSGRSVFHVQAAHPDASVRDRFRRRRGCRSHRGV